MTTRKIALAAKGITKPVFIGGDSPITIQTMWKEDIRNLLTDSEKLQETLKRLDMMAGLGCDIVRFAVPDNESAKALCLLADKTSMPLVADIHFDYKLALECLKGNVSAVRINPGNIGSLERVKCVCDACRDNGVPIRIGINSGSLPKDLALQVEQGKLNRADALSQTAAREAAVFDQLNFDQVVVSMKSSTVEETIACNRIFSSKYDIPLHIGVTEAGPLITGIVKSTMAFSTLLKEGIGNTIRVSLSSSPENEIITAREILHECGLRKSGVTIVSCPRCGRNGFDVHGFVDRWQNELLSLDKNITVAVMGCVVNGPGEGKHADIGIAGAEGKVIIFKKGKTIHVADEKDADNIFRKELESL